MNKSIPVLIPALFGPFMLFSQGSLETVLQKGHELAVVSVDVSPDSNYVVTGSKDKSIKLWERETGREIRSFLGHEKTVNNVDFSSDGNYVLSVSNDKTARIWSIVSGKEVFTLTTEDFLTDGAIDPSMKFFVVGGYNLYQGQDSAKIYDWKTKKMLTQIPIDGDNARGHGLRLVRITGS
jgi:WD40 repeat protein